MPEPAFEIFRFDTAVAGGALVQVMPQRRLQLSARRGAGGDHAEHARRLPDQPEQPDRRRRCRSTRSATIARRVPPGAVVFVDEAYAEFAGVSFIPELDAFPNVVVGRTFSKAYGLAGLRIGCLVGAPTTLDADPPARCRSTASTSPRRSRVQAALDDLAHLDALPARRSRESKALLYAACDRLGLGVLAERRPTSCWSGSATTRRARRRRARERGIYVRDRSTEPGCAGCLRITTGIVEHTRRAIAVMEEVLCAAR